MIIPFLWHCRASNECQSPNRFAKFISLDFNEHELMIKRIAKEMGFGQISCSSEVMPMVRAVPRGIIINYLFKSFFFIIIIIFIIIFMFMFIFM